MVVLLEGRGPLAGSAAMRKLFRMKYESCSGQCYAYSDVMRIHTLGLDATGAATFLNRLVSMHEPSCGNPNIEFRLDADEFTRGRTISDGDTGDYVYAQDTRFVASFYHYGSLDLFAGDSPLEAMNLLIDAALAFYKSDEYLAQANKGSGHGVCHHGDDRKLIEFAISFSGLDEAGQSELRAQFA